MNGQTDFLYAEPSFWSGAASVLDLGGTLFEFNDVETGDQADHIALMMDWQTIGDDLRRAMRQVAEEAGLDPSRFYAVAR